MLLWCAENILACTTCTTRTVHVPEGFGQSSTLYCGDRVCLVEACCCVQPIGFWRRHTPVCGMSNSVYGTVLRQYNQRLVTTHCCVAGGGRASANLEAVPLQQPIAAGQIVSAAGRRQQEQHRMSSSVRSTEAKADSKQYEPLHQPSR